MASLSWANRSAAGRGCSVDPLGDQQVEHVGGHVLVVEGDDVAVLGERVHGVGLACGRPTGELGTTSAALASSASASTLQGHPQLGGRAGAHPGELAPADDADDGEAAGCATWGGHPARIATARG